MNKIRVYLFTLKLCFRAVFKIQLGHIVEYRGKRYVVSNGTMLPTWDLRGIKDNEHLLVHEKDFKKVRSLANLIHSFRFTWSFYSGYWHSIWIRDPSKMRSYP